MPLNGPLNIGAMIMLNCG